MAKAISFFGAFLMVLTVVFAVNISTISTVEAKSTYSESKAKKKKYYSRRSSKYKRKNYRKAKRKRGKRSYKKRLKYKKKWRSKKRSAKVKNKKRYYKVKNKKRYVKRKYKKRNKRYAKAGYKKRKSKAKSFKKVSYLKRKPKRTKRRHRSRYITCDMLKSSILRRKARPYQKTISHAAKKYGVSQNMIKAVITVETCFRSGLKGTSGEKGLMQLMPATAKRFGVKNRFSPWENIHGGTRYLRYLLRHFDGNKGYAAAAYNGGRGAVSRKSGPKFKAVRVYSRKVMNAYRKFNPLIMAKSKKRKSRKKPVKQ